MALLVISIVIVGFAGFVIGFKWQATASLVGFAVYCFRFMLINSYQPTVSFFEQRIEGNESAPEVFALALLFTVFMVPCALAGWKLSHLFTYIRGVVDKVLGALFGAVIGFILAAVLSPIISLVIGVLFTIIVIFVDVQSTTKYSYSSYLQLKRRLSQLIKRNKPDELDKGDQEDGFQRNYERRKRRPRPLLGRRTRRGKDNKKE